MLPCTVAALNTASASDQRCNSAWIVVSFSHVRPSDVLLGNQFLFSCIAINCFITRPTACSPAFAFFAGLHEKPSTVKSFHSIAQCVRNLSLHPDSTIFKCQRKVPLLHVTASITNFNSGVAAATHQVPPLTSSKRQLQTVTFSLGEVSFGFTLDCSQTQPERKEW